MNSQSAETAPAKPTLLIRGIEIPVETRPVEQTKLRFYEENPRIYSLLHGHKDSPAQEQIQARLLQMEHVKLLIEDIRINQGLIEPLIVKDGTFEVLEGNSRLAAYRALAKADPVRWAYAKCTILPRDIKESLVFALLGQFHIKGKKDWAPFEQAGFLYRRFKRQNADVKSLALEIGMSSKHVSHLIETYQFMLDHGDNDVSRWSYYDEYLKSTKIKRARAKYEALDGLIVDKVRSGEIARAVDLREELPVICASPRVLAKFAAGQYDFETAYEAAVHAGGDSVHLKKVKKFREWVTRSEVERHLLEYEGTILKSLTFELRKIELKVHHLLKKLDGGSA